MPHFFVFKLTPIENHATITLKFLKGLIMLWRKITQPFAKKPLPANAPFLGRCILAIDDDVTQRTLIQRVLEKRGYRVVTTQDGRTGLEMAVTQRPDLILLDSVMPLMSGNEVCRRLKEDNRTKNIPVLFLTSLDNPKDVIEQYDLGAEIHLKKPISPKELISQIEMTFEEQKLT